MKPMPEDAHLAPPKVTNNHTVAECDEVLKRGCPTQEIRDAWLDERLSAEIAEMGAQVAEAIPPGLARELQGG
jgi:hypothetical protein